MPSHIEMFFSAWSMTDATERQAAIAQSMAESADLGVTATHEKGVMA